MLNRLREEGKTSADNDSSAEQSLKQSDFRVEGNIYFDKAGRILSFGKFHILLFRIVVHSFTSSFERKSPPSVLAAIGNPPHFFHIFLPIVSRSRYLGVKESSPPNACFESKDQQSSTDKGSNLQIGFVRATSTSTFYWRVVMVTPTSDVLVNQGSY
ncbi:putative disease resistance RPP13 protein [Trifolium repens]|nr:putative disease resistance RPP13 protein [Trifolium repens]